MAEKLKPLSPDPEVLARAGALAAKARSIVGEFSPTLQRGSFPSHALELSGCREFKVDGEKRKMEWRSVARAGRFSLRQFDPDSKLAVHLMLDGSDSMKYGSTGISKFEYARELSACLAYVTLLQEDSVQLSLFGEKIRGSTEAVRSLEQFSKLMEETAAWEISGTTGIGSSVRELVENLQPGGLVMILSDFFEENESWIEALERIRYHGNEVVLIQVMDTEEIEFPFEEAIEFESMEGGEKFKAHGSDLRTAYLEEVKLFFEKIRTITARCGSHYFLADTSKPLAEALESYLHFRRQARCL